jgi:hypothetical protein
MTDIIAMDSIQGIYIAIIFKNAVGITNIINTDFNPLKTERRLIKSVAFLFTNPYNQVLFLSRSISRSLTSICFFICLVQAFNNFLSNIKRFVCKQYSAA